MHPRALEQARGRREEIFRRFAMGGKHVNLFEVSAAEISISAYTIRNGAACINSRIVYYVNGLCCVIHLPVFSSSHLLIFSLPHFPSPGVSITVVLQ
jgi:hypothetical protein